MTASTEKYFPVKRAAEYLGCDASFIYYLINSGQIKAHPTGGKKHYSIPESELLKFSVYRQMKEDGMNVSISADSDAIEVSNEKYYSMKEIAELCGKTRQFVDKHKISGNLVPDRTEMSNGRPMYLFSEKTVLDFLSRIENGTLKTGHRGRPKKVEKTEPIEVPMAKEEIQERLPEDVRERFDKNSEEILNRLKDIQEKTELQSDQIGSDINDLANSLQRRDDFIASAIRSLGEGFTNVKTIYENTYAEIYHSAFKIGYETGFKDGKDAAMERARRVFGYSAKEESKDE